MPLQIQYNTCTLYMNMKVISEHPQNTFSFLRLGAKNNFRNISLADVLSLILQVLPNFVKNSPPAEKTRSALTEIGGIIILLVLHTTKYAVDHGSERNH